MNGLKILSRPRLGILLLSMLMALPAVAEEDWDWPRPKGERLDMERLTRCANPEEGQGRIDRRLGQTLRRTKPFSAEEALPVLERARRREYREPFSLPVLDWTIGQRLIELKRHREAIERLQPLVDSPYFWRAHTDGIREVLARLHLDLGEPDRALAWLEAILDPACDLPRESALLLAVDLHLHAERFEAALGLLNRADLPPTDRNLSWILTRIDLIDRLHGIEAAAAATLGYLRSPLRGPAVDAALAPIVEQLAEREPLRSLLDAAVDKGQLDEQFAIRPAPPINEVEPIERKPPPYPAKATYLGLSGVVKVLVKIDPEGKVTAIRILEASPTGYFEQAAIRSVRKWTFKPRLVGDQPSSALGVSRIIFEWGG